MSTGLVIFLLFLASLWLGTVLAHDPGYVLIYFNHWSLETTLFVAVTGLLLLFFIFHYCLRLSTWVNRLPSTWHAWRQKKHIQQARAKTRTGLIEFTEGHWAQARKHLIQGLSHIDTPLLNYLTAARAAQEMGSSKLRDSYLREAQQSMPEAKVAVELTQAQLQLAQKQWEQALATLKHLQSMVPNHPYVLKLLMRLYQAIEDWPQLLALLPSLKKHHVLSDKDFNQLQKQTNLETIKHLIDLNQMDKLRQLIDNLPKTLRDDIDIIALYTGQLIQQAEYKTAESILRGALKKQFSDKLIARYGQLNSSASQLKFAETFAESYKHSSTLFLTLGRLSEKQQLWGKAKTYLEFSISCKPGVDNHAALAQLLEQLGEHDKANDMYKAGLLIATS